MTVKQIHTESDCIYFITFSCYKWIPLIDLTSLHDHIYSWFKYLIEIQTKIVGFVIMPNHLHLLLYYPTSHKSINTVVGNGKRFMAYEIIRRLNEKKMVNVLERLREGVTKHEVQRGKLHRVFNPSFDAKICIDRSFVEQKLNYIHSNPVVGKWSLADDYANYPHSSAGFYELGNNSEVPITHYLDLL